MNRRIYISGGMSDIPNYEDNFNRAENTLKVFDYIPFNPIKWNEPMIKFGLSYLEMIKIDLTYLSMCDSIYMLKGWEKSEGACAELYFALYNGIKVEFEGEFKGEKYNIVELSQKCVDNMNDKITINKMIEMGVL